MSEETTSAPVEQPENTSGVNGKEQKDFVAYESFQKALNEKKTAQSKLSEYEKELQTLREEKLQREGKTEELVDTYRKQILELNESMSKKEKTYAWNTLTGEIKREALKLGCVDPDKLIRLMDDEDLRSINVGEDFTIDKNSLTQVIEKNKKDNFFLFNSSNKIASAGVPSKTAPNAKEKTEQDIFEDYIKGLK